MVLVKEYEVKEGLYYSEHHVWAKVEDPRHSTTSRADPKQEDMILTRWVDGSSMPHRWPLDIADGHTDAVRCSSLYHSRVISMVPIAAPPPGEVTITVTTPAAGASREAVIRITPSCTRVVKPVVALALQARLFAGNSVPA